jgi:outer membrane protein OmpA-like peptidoglycan-associated protein
VTHVFFASGSATIPTDQAARLDDFVEGLVRQGPGSGVRIGGFTDTVGSPSSNLELSRRRAEAVRVYLQARGIPDGSIEVRSLGETPLLLSTADGVDEWRNRRATIVEVVEPLDQAARRTAERDSGQAIPLC